MHVRLLSRLSLTISLPVNQSVTLPVSRAGDERVLLLDCPQLGLWYACFSFTLINRVKKWTCNSCSLKALRLACAYTRQSCLLSTAHSRGMSLLSISSLCVHVFTCVWKRSWACHQSDLLQQQQQQQHCGVGRQGGGYTGRDIRKLSLAQSLRSCCMCEDVCVCVRTQVGTSPTSHWWCPRLMMSWYRSVRRLLWDLVSVSGGKEREREERTGLMGRGGERATEKGGKEKLSNR